MAAEQATSFADEKDYDFNFEVLPPTATYVDTMCAFYGWKRDDADMQISIMSDAASDAYHHFGGTKDVLPLPVSEDKVLDWITEKDYIYLEGFQHVVGRLVHKYLIGEGDDYESFSQL